MPQLFILLLITSLGDIDRTYKYFKYGIMTANIIIFLLVIVLFNDRLERLKKTYSIINYYGLLVFLIGISIILQIYHLGSINVRTFNEIFFILAPLLLVTTILVIDDENLYWYIDKIAYIYMGMFIIRNIDALSMKNILSINFLLSYSPFESEYSHIFALFGLFFLFNKKYFKYLICIGFAFLSMKRATVLFIALCPLIFIYFEKIKNLKTKQVMIVFVLCNLIFLGFMYAIAKDSFSELFYQMTGRSLNAFTMGRTNILKFLIDGDYNLMNGFGYTTYFLRNVINYPSFIVIHGEHIKIFLETGIVGIIGFFSLFFYNIKNGKALLFAIFINIMFCFTHILDMSMILFVYFLIMAAVLREPVYSEEIENEDTICA